MKNLFDAAVALEIKERLKSLGLTSERRWGRMTVPQMLAHCSLSMQWAVGEVVPEKGPLPARILGQLIKPLVFRGLREEERRGVRRTRIAFLGN